MANINEMSNVSIIISSLEKIYNNLRLKGKSDSGDLYVLDAIYKILEGCDPSLSKDQRKELMLLYDRVSLTSDNICPTSILPEAYVNHRSNFEVESDSSCGNYPNLDNIYYWQETVIGKSHADILTDSNAQDFTFTKNKDTRDNFIIGIDVICTSVGKIGFFIVNSQASDNYKIYDANNIDVTVGFNKAYNTAKKSILFTSLNEYTPSTITFKIKL